MGTLKLPFRSQFITFLKKIIQEISKHIIIINASYEGICVELKEKQHIIDFLLSNYPHVLKYVMTHQLNIILTLLIYDY